ncbi:hypothetical protein J6590_078613 [Homalodisca vitripennis]|nr:hypothetical protein J6590_078613 [Homalodisca vitripennis]
MTHIELGLQGEAKVELVEWESKQSDVSQNLSSEGILPKVLIEGCGFYRLTSQDSWRGPKSSYLAAIVTLSWSSRLSRHTHNIWHVEVDVVV